VYPHLRAVHVPDSAAHNLVPSCSRAQPHAAASAGHSHSSPLYAGTQIRSHAQKYFQKVQKTGSTEPIPPPRPKRKPSDPHTADGRARTSDRSGSSGKQQAGGGMDSGGEEGGSNRAISSPAGLEATAEGIAHVRGCRKLHEAACT
jgi:hypothetical protein